MASASLPWHGSVRAGRALGHGPLAGDLRRAVRALGTHGAVARDERRRVLVPDRRLRPPLGRARRELPHQHGGRAADQSPGQQRPAPSRRIELAGARDDALSLDRPERGALALGELGEPTAHSLVERAHAVPPSASRRATSCLARARSSFCA